MSRVMLICCEGKTEELYFKILRDRVYRIPGYIKIAIQGEKGQHKALVDRVVEARIALARSQPLRSSVTAQSMGRNRLLPVGRHHGCCGVPAEMVRREFQCLGGKRCKASSAFARVRLAPHFL